jgi:hypothetical protein
MTSTSQKGVSVVTISKTPIKGPPMMTSAPPSTISDATLSHLPATSRPLRRSAPVAERLLELDCRGDQRPAAGQPDGDREEEDRARKQGDGHRCNDKRTEQRHEAVSGKSVGADGVDLPAFVELDYGARARCLNEPEAGQRECGADRENEMREEPIVLASRLNAEDARRVEHERLQERDEQRDRYQQDADADEHSDSARVDAPRCRQDLAPRPTAREAEGGCRSPGSLGRAR